MNKIKSITFLFPITLIILFVVLSYNNVIILRRSLNPVLFIPAREITLSTGYADITGPGFERHGWHVDLANPAYLEWPVNYFIGKSLKAGHIPVIMPYQNLGVPLIGQYCHRVLSPYQIIENIFFPKGYDFFLIFRLILAGIFSYLFIRPICLRIESALITSVSYGLGAVMVIYSNHEEVVNTAMLLPLLMWAIRAFFDHPGISRASWLTLALALVHTGGQPEIQLYVIFLALLYGLIRLFSLPGARRKNTLLYCLAAIFFSALIAAPQIFLFLRFHSEAWTFHPPGGNLGIQSPITIHRFLFAFFPKLRQTPWPWSYRTINLLWDWIGGYFGLGLLILAMAAHRSPHRNRRETFLFSFYFLFIILKNLGWSPAQLFGLLPLFDQTWSPRWATATWSFSLAVLAGFGLDNILEQSRFKTNQACPTSETRSLIQRSFFQNNSASRASKLLIHSLLFIAVIILINQFRMEGATNWASGQMRKYIISNSILFFLLGAGVIILYLLLPSSIRNLFSLLPKLIRDALLHEQTLMIIILAALVFTTLHWFPASHYLFSGDEPFAVYILAAPILLLSLSGLFYIAAFPEYPGAVIITAVAIPTSLIAGWVDLPGRSFIPIFCFLIILILGYLLFFKTSKVGRRFVTSLFVLLLFGVFLAFSLLASFFPEPSGEADRILRCHYYFAIFLIGSFSGLSWWTMNGGTGCGWYFLLLLWAELTIYIPKNHGDRYLLLDHIPFMVSLPAILFFFAVFRKKSLNPKKIFLILSLVLVLSGTSLFVIDEWSSNRLPLNYTPTTPLPFVSFLKDRQPHALVGIGRILSPNFAAAHNITDIRGCTSMNTGSFQFFLENILHVVPSGNSFSLWFTGNNPINNHLALPYGRAEREHLRSFEKAFPFYILASIRFVICPPGLLDTIKLPLRNMMKKIYSREIDIWELPSLPPAYIAHNANVISMEADTKNWMNAIINFPDILAGNRVILEDPPPNLFDEKEKKTTDTAELITGENPNRLKVKFYSEDPGYLVISRLYTNLLRAYLDGEEVPILKANGPFLAVQVSGAPRERLLELTYISVGTKISFGLSILGIFMTAAGLFIGKHINPDREKTSISKIPNEEL